ncbi:MAG TPA: mechanosensitive ion channel family protein [Candidatus Saccharimonadales bacterium]|nr:mechanosensitive ion channel family protein [Candidatus Saccharimonadales bacterium]
MSSEFINHTLPRILLTVAIAIVVQMISRRLTQNVVRRVVSHHHFPNKLDEKKREDTIINILDTLVAIVIWLIAILIVLDDMGVNLAALATGAGLFGIIIGLGAQNTIKDFLGGLFVLIENQYRVGDVVTLAGGTTGTGTSGVVEDISLRSTKLRDMEGNLNIVRNGEASVITNRTINYSSVVIDVLVPYEADIDKVEQVMNEVGIALAGTDEFKSLTVEAIQFLRIDSFTPNGATARAVGKVAPAAQWNTAGAYRRRLLPAFAKAGIHVPYAQVEVRQHHK